MIAIKVDQKKAFNSDGDKCLFYVEDDPDL